MSNFKGVGIVPYPVMATRDAPIPGIDHPTVIPANVDQAPEEHGPESEGE